MNSNFSLTNSWFQLWKIKVQYLQSDTKWPKEHMSNQAAIAQMNYVCYLAQEWAGARK